MTWPKFKEFLWKNFDDSIGFVDSIWKKVKSDSQYQIKLVQDWAAHLEYLQSILIEFDSKWAPEEGTMIRYFQKGLRPLLRLKMEQRDPEIDNFEELVEKAVDPKAKAALRPRFYTCKTDQHHLRGSRPSAAKANTQGQPMRIRGLKNLSPSLRNQRHQLFSIIITLRPPRRLGRRRKKTIKNIDDLAG